jgi:hypothetical protein
MEKNKNLYYNDDEQWIIWEACKDLKGYYHRRFSKITPSTLKLGYLKEKSNQRVTIETSSLINYMLFNESYSSLFINFLNKKLGRETIAQHCFFKVTKSPYIKNYCTNTKNDIQHYAILDSDELTYFLSREEPKVDIIELEE